MNSEMPSSDGPLHMDMPGLTDQKYFIYNSECCQQDMPEVINDRDE